MKVAFLTSIRQLYRCVWQLLLLSNSYGCADSRSQSERNYYYQDLRKLTFKAPSVAAPFGALRNANGIRPSYM
ncbi:MAG: hypothetical protein SWX82_14610 [Cyanobacteriota bacterium]|nr:hypothetical protein [Cyanobacteriota bacterium]